MATLIIRDLHEGVDAKLRLQAAKHGRSVGAEARALLTMALMGRPANGLGTYIGQGFADIGGVELALPDRDDPAPPTDYLGEVQR